MLEAVDSSTDIVQSTGEGLPPETKPKGRVKIKAEYPWGKVTVYEEELEALPESVVKIEKTQFSRRDMLIRSKSVLMDTTGSLKTVEEIQSMLGVGPKPSQSSSSSDAFWCLSFFQSSMIATILEDTITQIRILLECNNELRITKCKTDMQKLLALKYKIRQPTRTDELDGIDPRDIHNEIYKLNKLEADRNNILHFMVLLYVELSIENCFGALLDHMHGADESKKYAENITIEEAKNRLLKKDLTKQLRLQRNHQKTVLYDSEALINSLKAEVEDSSLLSETKCRYVDNWQNSRIEQHHQVISEKEGVYSKSMEYFKRRSDQESRVHSEVEALTGIVINENLQAIEFWMNKYEADIEKIDLKIQIQRSQYQSMFDQRVKMETTLEQRAIDMVEWVTFKEEREKQQLYEKTMHKSAITVQAWWRGILVRKKIGPYKEKKAPPKKK